VTGGFLTGDQITISLTDSVTGVQTQVGAGFATGVQPTFCMTFNNKVYAIDSDGVYFCAIGDPLTWNDPAAAGNGFVKLANNFGMANDVLALAMYQGKMACVGRRQVQIWGMEPDPASNTQEQVLPNIGTVAKLSVQSVGDMDVFMLADSGVRSVRVRDASNNAIIADIGTPIDAILQPLLASLTEVQKAAACGCVEPSSNRYWIYVPQPDGSAGSIYVFSYFSSSQISAWGTYSPTYQVAITPTLLSYAVTAGNRYAWKPATGETSLTCGSGASQIVLKSEGAFTAPAGATAATVIRSDAGATATGAFSLTTSFIPQKFSVLNGQVYCRSTAGNIHVLGGTDNATYDNCGMEFITPYIDSGTPASKKQFIAIDAAFQGTWSVNAAFDFNVSKYRNLYNNTAPSFMNAAIPWQAFGTHYSFQGVEAGSGYARFASLMCHQQGGQAD
jgi:hypothetical protein